MSQPVPVSAIPSKESSQTMVVKLLVIIMGLAIVIAVLLIVLIMLNKGNGTITSNQGNTSSSSNISSLSSNSSIPNSFPVQSSSSNVQTDIIYLYKGPLTQSDPTPGTKTLVPVSRLNNNTVDPYQFVLDQLIAGPTQSEKNQGLKDTVVLMGSSNCNNADYKLVESGTALKVQFCKGINYSIQTPNGGGYAGVSIQTALNVREEVKKSLTFGNITSVEVRDKNGQCLAPDAADPDCKPI